MVARQNLKIYNSNSNQEFEKLLNDNLTNSGIVEHTIVTVSYTHLRAPRDRG